MYADGHSSFFTSDFRTREPVIEFCCGGLPWITRFTYYPKDSLTKEFYLNSEAGWSHWSLPEEYLFLSLVFFWRIATSPEIFWTWLYHELTEKLARLLTELLLLQGLLFLRSLHVFVSLLPPDSALSSLPMFFFFVRRVYHHGLCIMYPTSSPTYVILLTI